MGGVMEKLLIFSRSYCTFDLISLSTNIYIVRLYSISVIIVQLLFRPTKAAIAFASQTREWPPLLLLSSQCFCHPTSPDQSRGPEERLSISFMEFPSLFKCSECSAVMVLSSTWTFLALAAYSSNPGKRWFACQIPVSIDKMQLCQMKFHVAIISLEGISKSVTPKLSKLEPRNVWCLPSVRGNVQKRLPKKRETAQLVNKCYTNDLSMHLFTLDTVEVCWGVFPWTVIQSFMRKSAKTCKNEVSFWSIQIRWFPHIKREEPFTNLFPLFSQTCQVSPSLNPSCHMQTSMTNLICSQPRSRSTCANFAKIRFGSFVHNSLLEQREVPNLLRECRSTRMVRAIHIPDVWRLKVTQVDADLITLFTNCPFILSRWRANS